MTMDRYLRMIAGFFVMLSLALGYWVSPYWFLFTAFVGLNLFQSAFTNWCPMMWLLQKLHVPACEHEVQHHIPVGSHS
ncbi:MAG TPA: DUF2892 domain-containing protein [Bryobacteraceae bacterium]|nr:DUF2892 domain-containing protein [Bryobacteraceae bacterium]